MCTWAVCTRTHTHMHARHSHTYSNFYSIEPIGLVNGHERTVCKQPSCVQPAIQPANRSIPIEKITTANISWLKSICDCGLLYACWKRICACFSNKKMFADSQIRFFVIISVSSSNGPSSFKHRKQTHGIEFEDHLWSGDCNRIFFYVRICEETKATKGDFITNINYELREQNKKKEMKTRLL